MEALGKPVTEYGSSSRSKRKGLNPWIPSLESNQVKVAFELHRSRKGRKEMLTLCVEGYSSIDSANERASSAAKSTRLITAFSFLSPARHLPSGCSQASCTGGQELRLAGYSLRPLPTRFFSSGPKLPFFAWKSLFVLILFASLGPTMPAPLLPHCVAIDSVLSGKKLILPRLTIRLLVNGVWVHPTCWSFRLCKPR